MRLNLKTKANTKPKHQGRHLCMLHVSKPGRQVTVGRTGSSLTSIPGTAEHHTNIPENELIIYLYYCSFTFANSVK